ncbi:hypothetical protein Cgig2_003740 [Carnegiea gigantea]|uniref:Uncharacterized protein n=1 Tax=Carnegiea gigantea TaxID=171969 RepID=A0A9Q1JRN4_9CARY|nr:hypothetical protein Cgig2_003740 [Carnegiea gigantea]
MAKLETFFWGKVITSDPLEFPAAPLAINLPLVWDGFSSPQLTSVRKPRLGDRIEPNNREITNELAKVESVNCQVGTSNKDLKESKHDGNCLRDSSGVESKSGCKEGINTPCQKLDMALGDESIITTISEDPCGEANIVTMPITGEDNDYDDLQSPRRKRKANELWWEDTQLTHLQETTCSQCRAL